MKKLKLLLLPLLLISGLAWGAIEITKDRMVEMFGTRLSLGLDGYIGDAEWAHDDQIPQAAKTALYYAVYCPDDMQANYKDELSEIELAVEGQNALTSERDASSGFLKTVAKKLLKVMSI